ncbi:MAG: ubiquinol-cytochrome C chaperone family protein [Sphingomicrobium sp.]
MIAKLFRRLTADPGGRGPLFDWATAAARDPGWYVAGGVPDTIDGRFAMVSTIAALCCARLEQLGREGETLSVALTERFAAVMESEHRELGLGDPKLGKTVLKLVGALARRAALLRPAMEGEVAWPKAANAALPGLDDSQQARDWRAARLEKLARRLQSVGVAELSAGVIP